MLNIRDKKAQTALELAVFGSILIFVLGGIIRSSVNRSNQQHAYLKATRMALAMSHKTTERKKVAGRNMATVLIVEDRLTVASAKYGALDRMPFITQGAGMHSANAQMPIDFLDQEDLPIFDMFVNGQHFVFTSAEFKTVILAIECNSDCIPDPFGDCTPDPNNPGQCIGFRRGPYASDPNQCEGYWEPKCIISKTVETKILPCAGASSSCPNPDGNCPDDCLPCANASPCPPVLGACEGPDGCDAVSTELYNPMCPNGCDSMVLDMYEKNNLGDEYYVGCAKLYTIIDNHPLIEDWCDDFFNPCPPDCSIDPGVGCNLSADDRFNLDRVDLPYHPYGLDCPNDGYNCLTDRVDVLGAEERGMFAWQWFMVMGADQAKLSANRTYNSDTNSLESYPGSTRRATLPVLNMAEGIILPKEGVKSMNTALDVDCDMKLEYIMSTVKENNVYPNAVGKNGVITKIGVMDQHEGDVDFTYNSGDELRGIAQFGFTKDVTMYSFVREDPDPNDPDDTGGTYFQIDEGKLYTTEPDRQFIRTTSKKDQADLIERAWQLNNNTKGYCRGPDDPRPDALWRTFYGFDALYDTTTPNPVEACKIGGGCYDDNNINLTCMDLDNNVILIRSRIQDLHGRKWVTDTSDDPYVDFDMPPAP